MKSCCSALPILRQVSFFEYDRVEGKSNVVNMFIETWMSTRLCDSIAFKKFSTSLEPKFKTPGAARLNNLTGAKMISPDLPKTPGCQAMWLISWMGSCCYVHVCLKSVGYVDFYPAHYVHLTSEAVLHTFCT